MPDAPFERCVFLNCPFDKNYEPILQAILFCVTYVGLTPRIASERQDGGETRIEKIRELIENSRFSIHDLSRCQATEEGELFRLNMPFELGIDYGCRQFRGEGRETKKILVLEEKSFRYQAAISDWAGCDIQAHGGSFEKAVRKVRNWLRSEADLGDLPHGSRILGAYVDFQEWHYERQLSNGATDEDIQDYPTRELLDAMSEWVALGTPI